MLAYAANRPVIAARRPSPNAMLAIIASHVAVVALVMSAKMEMDRHRPVPPIIVDTIPAPKPPPPDTAVRSDPRPRPLPTAYTQPDPVRPLPDDAVTPTGPTATDPGPVAINGGNGIPQLPTPVTHNVVKLGPRLATPPSELKPPYPPAKLASEEEAVLRLRLTIDENGGVAAVDPVGASDRAFLDAARRHLIAHWRYKPATEDGHAVSSSAVITLRFQLDG